MNKINKFLKTNILLKILLKFFIKKNLFQCFYIMYIIINFNCEFTIESNEQNNTYIIENQDLINDQSQNILEIITNNGKQLILNINNQIQILNELLFSMEISFLDENIKKQIIEITKMLNKELTIPLSMEPMVLNGDKTIPLYKKLIQKNKKIIIKIDKIIDIFNDLTQLQKFLNLSWNKSFNEILSFFKQSIDEKNKMDCSYYDIKKNQIKHEKFDDIKQKIDYINSQHNDLFNKKDLINFIQLEEYITKNFYTTEVIDPLNKIHDQLLKKNVENINNLIKEFRSFIHIYMILQPLQINILIISKNILNFEESNELIINIIKDIWVIFNKKNHDNYNFAKIHSNFTKILNEIYPKYKQSFFDKYKLPINLKNINKIMKNKIIISVKSIYRINTTIINNDCNGEDSNYIKFSRLIYDFINDQIKKIFNIFFNESQIFKQYISFEESCQRDGAIISESNENSKESHGNIKKSSKNYNGVTDSLNNNYNKKKLFKKLLQKQDNSYSIKKIKKQLKRLLKKHNKYYHQYKQLT